MAEAGRLVEPAVAFWAVPLDAVLDELGTGAGGLTSIEAEERLAGHGLNTIERRSRGSGGRLLLAQFTSPIVLLLVGATVLSVALGDLTDGAIILAIVLASGLLGFFQERSAGQAVEALLAQVGVVAEVRRDGVEAAIPVERLVPGDVVRLHAGDIVPADCRVLDGHSLLVDQAALTGESYPADKEPEVLAVTTPLAQRANALYLGTHVVSGTGTAVVVRTGRATELGAVSDRLGSGDVTTEFERGVAAFGALLVRAMAVLTTLIFVANVVLDRPLVDSFLFSLALAVGLTPQMLPAIVAVSLSTGARRMAHEKVIVKRLDAIEDFGAMTVLCTDKTGTITAGAVTLDAALGLDGAPSDEVLRLAGLNAGLQRGFDNPIDTAVLARAPAPQAAVRLDEVPYDFRRKRIGILVDEGQTGGDGHGPVLVTKGAVATVVDACTTASVGGRIVPLDDVRDQVGADLVRLSGDGFRVLGVATRPLPGRRTATAADEAGMTLRGLLAFHDPPKAGVREAIHTLDQLGVSVRLITGDNCHAARHVAREVGLPADDVLTGSDIDALDDADLARHVAGVAVFAEVEPLHKERLVEALKAGGEVVGFLGDGINDAAALHAADVGISVDTAVDVAKQAAAIVLLDKSLAVVSDGVRLGRQTFANTLKYVRVTTSANFGNMLSMAVAAVVLPFLPLLPRQILLLNFLTDLPGTTIAADRVDPEQLDRPQAWDIRSIRGFMVAFGLISTIFDLLTFATLRLAFDAGPTLFRSGWFVESTATELAVMLVLRTRRPFFRSRPGRALLSTSAAVAAITLALPYSPIAEPLGFTAVPRTTLAALALLTILYVTVNELAKRRLMAPRSKSTPSSIAWAAAS